VLNGSVEGPAHNGNNNTTKSTNGLLSPGRDESSGSGGKSKARESGGGNSNSNNSNGGNVDNDDRSKSREIVVPQARGERGEGVDTAKCGDDAGSVETMSLEEIGGRLAQLLMVVRMVEEQSDLSAFLLPVELSVPANNDRGGTRGQKIARTGTDHPASAAAAGGAGDVSSSDSEADEDSDDDNGGGGGRHREGVGNRAGVG
ncbi:unnamed protein product, partial [Sphacelaria rigidula]